jgi:hypothetical protein
MIELATAKYHDLIEYINSLNLTSVPCQIVVLPDYDCIQDKEDDDVGFACYQPENFIMYVAGMMPDIPDLQDENEKLYYKLINIAHEYIHHVQNIQCRDFDEDEAEERACAIVNDYFAWLNSLGR